MLTPRSDDPNREAELERAKREPDTFGLISLDLDGYRQIGEARNKFGLNYTIGEGLGERPRPSELILPRGVRK